MTLEQARPGATRLVDEYMLALQYTSDAELTPEDIEFLASELQLNAEEFAELLDVADQPSY